MEDGVDQQAGQLSVEELGFVIANYPGALISGQEVLVEFGLWQGRPGGEIIPKIR